MLAESLACVGQHDESAQAQRAGHLEREQIGARRRRADHGPGVEIEEREPDALANQRHITQWESRYARTPRIDAATGKCNDHLLSSGRVPPISVLAGSG